MTISLLTRGYVCPRAGSGGAQVFGVGPTIVGAEEELPAITASGGIADPSISLDGVEVGEPSITGAGAEEPAGSVSPPTIISGIDQTPNIVGGEGEE